MASGTWIYNYYGQTELAPLHTTLKAEDALIKLGSAGMGGRNMETRIEDEMGQPINEAGVPEKICGRDPQIMIMYFTVPKKVVRVDALAETPTGKMFKCDMRKRYAELFSKADR